MQLNVSRLSRNGLDSYELKFEGLGKGDYRVRMFMLYDGYLSYRGDYGAGLSCDVAGTLCDDWMSEFRPPRIDRHKFNTELSVPVNDGVNVINFTAPINTESESYIASSVTNPANILVERKVNDYEIRRILVGKNEVFLELDSDSLADGTAITVFNEDLAAKHLLGTDGMRVCGNYRIYKVSGTVYKYTTGHYTDVKKTVEIDAKGYEASVWETVYYECGDLVVARVSEESAKFKYSTLGFDYVAPFAEGDMVFLDRVSCKVLDVQSNLVYVNAVLGDQYVTVPFRYVARTPSAAICVNWSSLPARKSDPNDVPVSNESLYDQRDNTTMVYPYIDSYFVAGETYANHANEDVLVCAGGDKPSIVCMRFSANSLPASDDASATLRLYIAGMSYSEASLGVYQMTDSSWNALMTYDEITNHLTNIPIGTVSLQNPAMLDDNGAYPLPQDKKALNTSYFNCVNVTIESSILSAWLSGGATYTPSIAIKIIGDGAPMIKLASTMCDDDQKPCIVLTGGQEGETDPETFPIVLSSDTIEPGQVLRITPDDPSVYNFGNFIYSDVVKLGNVDAPIVSGDPTRIDVRVPDDVYGSVQVMVYRKTEGREVPLTDEGSFVYVNGDESKRNVKLAKKLTPGVIDANRVGRSALYNRDMGFVNMTEVTDETSLIQNVYSILLTNPGERLFNQDFGTGIEERLFKLGSKEDGIDLLKECIKKVSMYEPRVYIDGDQSLCEFDDSENLYYLLLAVVLPTARTEMIRLPFKKRGRML